MKKFLIILISTIVVCSLIFLLIINRSTALDDLNKLPIEEMNISGDLLVKEPTTELLEDYKVKIDKPIDDEKKAKVYDKIFKSKDLLELDKNPCLKKGDNNYEGLTARDYLKQKCIGDGICIRKWLKLYNESCLTYKK